MTLSEWERIGVDDVETWARKYADGSRAYDIYPGYTDRWRLTMRLTKLGAMTTTFGAPDPESAKELADSIAQQFVKQVLVSNDNNMPEAI